MASYNRISVKPIAGALGAEISGVDLAQLDDETFNEIIAAWHEHLVVFFRDQRLSPDQQLAFSKRFGDIHYHPYMKGMESHPEILEIIKEETDTKSFGSVWHTDQMFNPNPAKATILYAKETPDAGGDTMFANGYLAYEGLSDSMKALCETLKTWNVGDRRNFRPAIIKRRRRTRRALQRQSEDGSESAAAAQRPANRERASFGAHAPRDRPQSALHRQSYAEPGRL